MERPILKTERLTLRPFTPDDAPRVQELASAYEVALNTLTIPHPYPEDGAEQWISTHDDDYREDRIHHFAIDDDGEIVGTIGLIMKGNGIAEIGYWIGVPYWGRGYATEAAREILRYGFEDCGLHRIFACYLPRNPASGRVMQKIGMTYEGTLRHQTKKWDEYQDLVFYGILREEWMSRTPRPAR